MMGRTKKYKKKCAVSVPGSARKVCGIFISPSSASVSSLWPGGRCRETFTCLPQQCTIPFKENVFQSTSGIHTSSLRKRRVPGGAVFFFFESAIRKSRYLGAASARTATACGIPEFYANCCLPIPLAASLLRLGGVMLLKEPSGGRRIVPCILQPQHRRR